MASEDGGNGEPDFTFYFENRENGWLHLYERGGPRYAVAILNAQGVGLRGNLALDNQRLGALYLVSMAGVPESDGDEIKAKVMALEAALETFNTLFLTLDRRSGNFSYRAIDLNGGEITEGTYPIHSGSGAE
jgi:hypothetical protein